MVDKKSDNDDNKEKIDKISTHIKEIIKLVDPNPDREELKKTPLRFAKAFDFINQGNSQDPKQVLESAIFYENTNEIVLVKDIELYSICEHHLLPFLGKAHIAYIPNKKIVGLSKIARVVDIYSRRLQIQERLTNQILNTIQETLEPLGTAIVIEAKHLCMMMRGVEKQNSITTTSAFTGQFKEDATRNEFISLVSSKLLH